GGSRDGDLFGVWTLDRSAPGWALRNFESRELGSMVSERVHELSAGVLRWVHGARRTHPVPYVWRTHQACPTHEPRGHWPESLSKRVAVSGDRRPQGRSVLVRRGLEPASHSSRAADA